MSSFESTGPIVLRGEGLVLREWEDSDVPTMVELFDTDEMDRWTPLAHPFDREVARRYVRRAHEAKAVGTLQLAITCDARTPLGEVLLFPASSAGVCELAYAVGAEHRGLHLAARAIRALLPFARDQGYGTAELTIAVDNLASRRVAEDADFSLVPGPTRPRQRKGYVLDMATWRRSLAD